MAAGKLAKSDRRVDYREASPLKFRVRCGTCSMYLAGGGCTAVAGVIVPVGVCDLWQRKTGRPASTG